VTRDEAERLTRENEVLKKDNAELQRRLTRLEASHETERAVTRAAAKASSGTQSTNKHSSRTFTAEESFDNETLYQAIKARLMTEAPALLRVLVDRPELEVSIERRVIEAEGASTLGRVARLIRAEFLTDSRRFSEILRELERTGTRVNNKSLSVALSELVVSGFLTKESVDRYRAVPDMTVRIVEAA